MQGATRSTFQQPVTKRRVYALDMGSTWPVMLALQPMVTAALDPVPVEHHLHARRFVSHRLMFGGAAESGDCVVLGS